MDVVALVSGGKDSLHSLVHAVANGCRVICLANLRPKEQDELDSQMYQTVGHEVIDLIAEAVGVELVRVYTSGKSVKSDVHYEQTAGDEVEDLYNLLSTVKEKYPSVKGVCVGAILSDYQRYRVEDVCARLSLMAVAYLWQRPQEHILAEMIAAETTAVLIKVAALGLKPKPHLGKTLAEMQPLLTKLNSLYGVHVCGEGGEYETLVLDCALFRKRIVIDKSTVIVHSDDPIAPVAYLKVDEAHLEDKQDAPPIDSEALTRFCRARLARATVPFLWPGTWPDSPENLVLPVMADVVGDCNSSDAPAVGADEADGSKAWSLSSTTTPTTPAAGAESKHFCRVLPANDAHGSVAEQANDVFRQLDRLLSKHGSSHSHVIDVFLGVADMADFSAINSIYVSIFQYRPPVRACVQLSLPQGVALQLDCKCHHPQEPQPAHHSHKVMHVRSRSYWAPQNIGPYSQAVTAGGVVHLAGMIGLNPATMELVDGFDSQCALALHSCKRVLQANGVSSFSNVVAGTCFVTRRKSAGRALALLASMASQVEPVKNVRVVVVKRLPRDALVEWQFRALTDRQRDAEQTVTVTLQHDIPDAECQCLSSPEDIAAVLRQTVSLVSNGLPLRRLCLWAATNLGNTALNALYCVDDHVLEAAGLRAVTFAVRPVEQVLSMPSPEDAAKTRRTLLGIEASYEL